MAEINFTADQRKALDITKSAVVVSAAAGSGKTAVLAERICKILCSEQPDISPDQLLVVTFTRAAAKEMSERVERRLRELLRENPNNRCLRRKLMLPFSNFSTIDSFCQKLVKEYFFYCDIQGDFGIADKAQLADMSSQALDNAIESMYSEYGEDFEDLSRALLVGYGDLGLRSSAEEIYKYINSLPQPEKFLSLMQERYAPCGESGNYYVKKQLKFLKEEAELIKCELAVFKESHPCKSLPNTDSMQNWIDRLILLCCKGDYKDFPSFSENLPEFQKNILSDKEKEYVLKALSEDEAKAGGHTEKELFKIYLKEADSFEKKLLDKISSLSEKYLKNFKNLDSSAEKLNSQTGLLCEFVRRYSQNLYHIKKEKNLYSFSDIEHKALSLIYDFEREEPTELGRELSGRFVCVMADEYQDTNDLQDKIFSLLSDGGKKLFAVGDAKQSIYRFRLANPEVFLNLRDAENLKECESVYLSANFRSSPGICETVNTVFSSLMSREVGDVDYNKSERLVSKADYVPSSDSSSEYWLIDRSLCKEDDIAVAEAHYIAKWIREKLDSGYEIYDPSVKAFRKMQPGDIAILARSINSYGKVYKDILEGSGIPAFFKCADNPYSSLEVRMVLDLLKALCNPRYDLPLASLLLSPFCSLSAEDLAKIRLYSGEELYSALILAAEDGFEKARNALNFINGMRREMQKSPLPIFLENLYFSGGFYALVGAMKEGEARRSNLCALVDLARQYEENSDSSVMGFIKKAESMAKEKADSSAFSSGSADAVNIMSIHGSKGLEFPVCFVAGLSRSINTDSKSAVFLHRRAGVGFTYYDRKSDMRFNNLARSVVEAENRRECISEELRILYVALTRAKNKLILISSERNMDKKLSDILQRVSPQIALGSGKLSPAFVLSCGSYTDLLLSAFMISPAGGDLKNIAAGKEKNSADSNSLIEYRRFAYSESVKTKEENLPQEEGIADEKTAGILKKRFDYEYPYLKDLSIPSKITASEINRIDHGELYNFTRRPDFMQEGGLSAAEKGTALHTFMQFCDFSLAARDAKAEGERLRNKGFITEKQLESIDFPKAAGFFKSSLYKRISESEEVMREKQFTVLMDAAKLKIFENCEREIVVQGVCDLAFSENGKLTVVDYKTDRCNSAKELFERYSEQLGLYAVCLGEITGYEIGKIGIYSFYKDEIYQQDFTNPQEMI